jgi:D-alanyl-D-alanine dipeptidase
MRQARRGLPLDDPPQTSALTAAEAFSYAGRYGEGEQAIELTAREEHLYLTPLRGGSMQELRAGAEDDLITDGRLGYGLRLIPRPNAMQDGPNLLTRHPDLRPAPCPMDWRTYLGEYGWDHDVLYVLERGGKLTVLIEWYDYYPLEQVSPGVFRFPGWGLYDGETLTFTWQGAVVGGVLFPRRPSPGENGYFRITPAKPIEALREAALSATPPIEKGPFRPLELVEIRTLDRTIKLDIRYANSTNFLGVPLYTQARAFLQRPAAEALLRAHRELSKQGIGLLIHDAYRPWYVTRIFWDATPEDKHIFVADPAKGSRHNRGCAVDLTLYDLKTGKPLEMTGGYDEMSERSYPDYPGGTSLARWNRELLRRTMEAQGFRVYSTEWWHFDYKDSEKYGIQNIGFESLSKGIK